MQETLKSRWVLALSAHAVRVPHLRHRGIMPYEAQDWVGPWTCAQRLMATWSSRFYAFLISNLLIVVVGVLGGSRRSEYAVLPGLLS